MTPPMEHLAASRTADLAIFQPFVCRNCADETAANLQDPMNLAQCSAQCSVVKMFQNFAHDHGVH